MDPRKVFVLDTSVSAHDRDAYKNFQENLVVYPGCVLEEFDRLKNSQDTKGSNVRAVVRDLDALRSRGSLSDGVPLDNGGVLYVDHDGDDFSMLPGGLKESNDNRILAVALSWKNKNYRDVVIVTKDINLRVKANTLGITAEDYENDKAIKSSDQLYTGFVSLVIPESFEGDIFSAVHRDGYLRQDQLDFVDISSLLPNQCCEFVTAGGGKSFLALYKRKHGTFVLVPKPGKRHEGKGIKPINNKQALAYALLRDQSIRVVSIVGEAGTGKTLLALLAGYEMLRMGAKGSPGEEAFGHLRVYRPNNEKSRLGSGLGFLPGDKREKMEPWAKPAYILLNKILKGRGVQTDKSDNGCRAGNGREAFSFIEAMVAKDVFSVEPLTYLRGWNEEDSFAIADEVQNLTPHEVKTVVSRMEDDSKIVILGDIGQIDNFYVDAVSNGLTHAVEKLKGQEIYGHILLTDSERSEVARLAARLL